MPTSPTGLGTGTESQAEAALAGHPGVARASVTREPGTGRLVAHVVPRDPVAEAGDDRARVDEWQLIYEWVYGELPEAGGLGENFVGWHSTYTGLPIELAQMREWRDATVERIRALRPRRVLEIGVGTGLLMAKLARECEEYVATDFSATVIETLTGQVAADPALAHVRLHNREATDFSGLPPDRFDTVVINSVVQYFPDIGYLADVLRQAAALVVPGGAVFVGDVRNLRLLRAFRTAVLSDEIAAAPETARELVENSVLEEKELLVDPDFFPALAATLPGIAAADVRLKRARHHNELSRHRYDAVLRKEPAETVEPAHTLAWNPAALETLLSDTRPPSARITGVPNGRVARELAALAKLDTGTAPAAVTAPDPEDLHEIGRRRGYQAAVTWSAEGAGLVDVVYTREPVTVPASAATPGLPFTAYANAPSRAAKTSTFVAELRAYLAARLPAEALPHAFVTVEDLPEGTGHADR
ncbi:methyltransferase [Amycolatopsis vancoresmycina]|uniref:Amino acid adenylation protein n=1 Tax=Amycolatopsis vancoresmycina DSM 44592 TaxID=1292037 RepID=R1IEF4_9PSEU|nr:methyltransferase [Amycolatopsis vancoresmycina]EOD68799.1 amino acid adenylation protein [Amycolatopsis vancoresmycina DSM 44592]